MVRNTLPTEFGETLELRRFTSDEYMAMVDAGILTSEDHVELIDGIILAMSPSGSRHNSKVSVLLQSFAAVFDRCVPFAQGTCRVNSAQVLDPDFMLARPHPTSYRDALPTPADLLLLLEVADTSLSRDRAVKLPIYATAGVREYWIIDLTRDVVIVHRDPQGDAYRTVTEHGRGEMVAAKALPDHAISVDPLVE